MKADAHWLSHDRLSFYTRIFAALFVAFGIGCFFISEKMFGQKWIPLGNDFVTFWAASHIALTGNAQDAYDVHLLLKAEQLVIPAVKRNYVWLYPPTFYLVVLPLSLLSYTAAYWTFMLPTLGAYILVLRRIIRGRLAMWCLFAFSGLWLNLFCGQNAFLTAALCGAALLSLERRPVLAGLFIGLLAIKPHLAILFPVALIAIGAWRTFITAAVTAITFTAIGTATLGTAALKGFLANLGYARLILENGTLPWAKMASIFAGARLLGIPVAGSYVIHAVVAVAAIIFVWRVWHRCEDRNLRGASLMTATFLVSPYVFDYDLAWLSFPIAWMTLNGLRNGWLRGEREVLVAAWLLPMFIYVSGKALNVQLAPLVICCLLWMTYRRAATASMTGATATGSPSDQIERSLKEISK